MIETRAIESNFNGIKFEIQHNCIVYNLDGLTYFVLKQKMPNLDEAIAENVANELKSLDEANSL